MAWRETHILRIPRRYLLLAGESLMLGLFVLGADVVFNSPPDRWDRIVGNSIVEHNWTISGPGGGYGLIGLYQHANQSHFTVIVYPGKWNVINFSIYTVIACANCLFIAAFFLVLGIIKRKRPAVP